VDFSDLPGLNSTSNFSLVPATTTSGNSVIYKGTNVSDYGGIGNPTDASECDCQTKCNNPAYEYASCSDCVAMCALNCASGENLTFPVEFADFTGRWDNGTVELRWATATELNNDFFAIERSVDGLAFQQVGTVPGSGTTNEMSAYAYTDRNVAPQNWYYRLRQVDFDGEMSYSPTIKVHAEVMRLKLTATALPDDARLAVNIVSAEEATGTLMLIGMDGRVLQENRMTVFSGTTATTLPAATLPNGYYLIRWVSPNGTQSYDRVFWTR